MSKLFIESLEGGTRVNVSVGDECDADVVTRLHVTRPSSRPPAALGEDVPTVRRMPRPPRVPRFAR